MRDAEWASGQTREARVKGPWGPIPQELKGRLSHWAMHRGLITHQIDLASSKGINEILHLSFLAETDTESRNEIVTALELAGYTVTVDSFLRGDVRGLAFQIQWPA